MSATEVWLLLQLPLAPPGEGNFQVKLVGWNGQEPRNASTYGAHDPITTLYADGAGAVWVAGQGADLQFWSDSDTGREMLPWYDGIVIHAMSGKGPNDIWAAGGNGLLFHWDGHEWSGLQEMAQWTSLNDIAGTSPTDIWAVGGLQSEWLPTGAHTLHWDGDHWSASPSNLPPSFSSVQVFPQDRAWAVGGDIDTSGSLIARWDDGQWYSEEAPESGMLTGVWGASPDELWAVGAGAVGPAGLNLASFLLRVDGVWTTAKRLEHTLLMGVWGLTKGNAWAWGSYDGNAVIHHWDGHDWVQQLMGIDGLVLDVHGLEATDLWAVVYRCKQNNECFGSIMRGDGEGWYLQINLPEDVFRKIIVRAKDDVWVLGEKAAYHWDTNGWTQHPTSWPGLVSMDLIGTDLWAVGDSVVIRKGLSN